MNTVLNGFKLIGLISGGLFLLLGLGWILIGPLLHGSLIGKKRDISWLQEIPLTLLAGMTINYGITLLFQVLRTSLWVAFILALFGFTCLTIHFFRHYLPTLSFHTTWYQLFFIIGTGFLFMVPILLEPLSEWDARSIWFFHAKMIYVARTIGLSAGWSDPSVLFSHPDYPMLVPGLAAQVTSVFKYWNEFLPKISLFFVLSPAILWLYSFVNRSFGEVFLFLLIPFSFFPWIWNGYMDGILAIYFSLALLHMGRYLKSSSTIDILSSLFCLVFLLFIKNEGTLAVISGLCGIFLMFIHRRRFYSIKYVLTLKNWKYYIAVLITLLPFILWIFYKHQWNLYNDLQIGTGSFVHIIDRFTDGSYKLLLRSLFLQIQPAILLLGIIYFTSVIWKKQYAWESLPALIASGFYCVGLIFIYLLTPNDLSWQIATSLNRTVLCINGGLFITCYFLLDRLIQGPQLNLINESGNDL